MSYKRWLFLAVFLFGVGLVLGLSTPTKMFNLLAGDVAALKELAGHLASLPRSSLWAVIFIKNVSALLVSFVLSPFFCLVPIMALVVNGWLLGLVVVTVTQEKSLGYLFAGLLPHGLFELPAFIIGEAVALYFGSALILALFKKERRGLLLFNLRQGLNYLSLAIILLFLAAIIEVYLTPLWRR